MSTGVIIVLIILALIASTIPLSILYFKFGFFKKFYHDLLGWHEPDEKAKVGFDGCSLHTICKYCHKEIMQDSQGNWF